MASEKFKCGRRQFLAGAIGAIGGYAIASETIPALRHLVRLQFEIARNPKKLTNTEVSLFGLAPGQTMAAAWNNNTVYIMHRTQQEIGALETSKVQLADPDSDVPNQPTFAKNPLRSLKPEYLVVTGMCTHLGCSIAPVKAGEYPFIPEGGFYCACHGGLFDLAGRVYMGTPPPTNLQVPPHHFKDEHTLIIGQNAPS